MVIWLRNPRIEGASGENGIGVAGDVVRGTQLAAIVDIDAVYGETNRRCAAALEAARAEAQALVEAAREEAAVCMAAAQDEYASAAARGYDHGLHQALIVWHERNAQAAVSAGALQARMRERLAEIVVMAVEQIVTTTNPALLFVRALASVDRIVADGSPVKVRVHPDELAVAAVEFGRAASACREGGRSIRLQVTGDTALAPGSCVCETDLGAVDASLASQLAAMRAAVARAVERMPDLEPGQPQQEQDYLSSDHAGEPYQGLPHA
jgi:type III secretion protein L